MTIQYIPCWIGHPCVAAGQTVVGVARETQYILQRYLQNNVLWNPHNSVSKNVSKARKVAQPKISH